MLWTRVRDITTPSVIGRSVWQRPARWPGSSLALASWPAAGPHTLITRDPAWSAGAMTAILTASPRVDTEQERSPRYLQGPGNRFAERAAPAAMPDRRLVTLSD